MKYLKRTGAAPNKKNAGQSPLAPRMLAGARRSAGSALTACGTALLLLVLAVRPAAAVTDITPYATVAWERNSNVFEVPSGAPPFAASGNTELGDSLLRYTAGIVGAFSFGPDKLSLSAQGEHFDYDRFNELNHNEYKFGGQFDWHLGPIVDGMLGYSQSHTMEAFADTLSTQLLMQTDKLANAKLRVLITPEWRFDVLPSWHDLLMPQELYPDFGLREKSVGASINYLGISKLTAGLLVEYTDGNFHDIVAATRYHQTTAALTSDYAVTGLSSFHGELGYTVRDSSLINPAEAASAGGAGGQVGRTGAVSGALSYRRTLSEKTIIEFRVQREVDSYVAGANPEIGTGGQLSLLWKPDFRFEVSLHGMLEQQSIEGQGVIANFSGRVDHVRSAGLDIKYHAFSWLTLRPYASHEQRTSNFAEANYTVNVFGIDLTARLAPK